MTAWISHKAVDDHSSYTYIIDRSRHHLAVSVQGEMTVLKVIIKKCFGSTIWCRAGPLLSISDGSVKSL